MFRVPEHRFFLLGRPIQVIVGGSGSGGVRAFMQFASAESVQHAFQIVSGCGQADFCFALPAVHAVGSVDVRRYGISNWRTDVRRWLVAAASHPEWPVVAYAVAPPRAGDG